MAPSAGGAADQVDQCVARHHRIGCGAGVTIGTGAVELAGCNTGEPDTRTFLAPYGAIAVPHGFGGAGESLAGRHTAAARRRSADIRTSYRTFRSIQWPSHRGAVNARGRRRPTTLLGWRGVE